jgi:predicted metal-binding protein
MYKTTLYATTSGGILAYEFQTKNVQAQELKQYVDLPKFAELCRTGCINYAKKWSCPPFAPAYDRYISKYKFLTVCVMSINLSQFSYVRNDYLKVKAGNIVLKSRIDRALRALAVNGLKYISTGSCRLCKPCKCKIGEKCSKPDKMAFSFEALGVDVNSMTVDLFLHELRWYKKGFLPTYTTVVAGLLSNTLINTKLIEEKLVNYGDKQSI